MSLFRKPKKIIQRRVFTQNDDDEEESPQLSRSNLSLSLPQKYPKPKQPLLSFETEEEGEVFQVKKSSHNKKVMKMFEKERHKKKEAKVEKDTNKPKDKTEIVTDDLVLVVNHNSTVTPPPPPPPLILSGRDALCAGKDDLSSDEDSSSTHRFSKPDNFKRVLESGAIPDAAMIHAARKKRQRAREMGDVIPLEEEEPEDKGRLLRDDEHDDSDDERIDMDVNLAQRDQERRREQFLAAQASDPEIDDEWEHQQIRKGVTGAPILDYAYSDFVEVQPPPAPMISTPEEVPKTPQMIADQLREHYESVRASREQNVQKLLQMQAEVEQIGTEISKLKQRAPAAAKKFKFYQELRGYVTDLVECLDEKVEAIANLEQKSIDLCAKRSGWLIERRRQDVRDQAEEATKGPVRKTEDEEKIRRAAEREGRRTRRRRAREIAGQVHKHLEGMSSDDEVSQQDSLNFETERDQIRREVSDVFEDVVEDYSTIASILIRFEEWRETDRPAYNDAYGGVCLPKVVSPLIRLDLVFWDPVTSDSADIEKLDWFRTLALYGLHDDETESTLSIDPDNNLVPILVEKILIGKITQIVDRCWDPLSSSQTLKLLGLITRYLRKFPTLGPGSKPLMNLFNAILHKMRTALEHDVFIPLTPKLIESKSPFFQRQFASGLKLLKNITSWQGVLNDATLKELALKDLLNRYLLSSVKFCLLTDAVSKVALISLILPRVWLQGGEKELGMFSACVMNLSQQLDKNNPLHFEGIESISSIMKNLRS